VKSTRSSLKTCEAHYTQNSNNPHSPGNFSRVLSVVFTRTPAERIRAAESPLSSRRGEVGSKLASRLSNFAAKGNSPIDEAQPCLTADGEALFPIPIPTIVCLLGPRASYSISAFSRSSLQGSSTELLTHVRRIDAPASAAVSPLQLPFLTCTFRRRQPDITALRAQYANSPPLCATDV